MLVPGISEAFQEVCSAPLAVRAAAVGPIASQRIEQLVVAGPVAALGLLGKIESMQVVVAVEIGRKGSHSARQTLEVVVVLHTMGEDLTHCRRQEGVVPA